MPRRQIAIAASLLACLYPVGASWAAPQGAQVKAYKRDPMPLYDAEGAKAGEVARSALPAPGSAGANVVASRPGFVGLMMNGKVAWLRLSMVDYVGDVSAVACEKLAVRMKAMEEEGIDQSLGLECAQ